MSKVLRCCEEKGERERVEKYLADTIIGRTHLFLGKPNTPENMASFLSAVPLGRPATPADVANACCYLASDEADFITGVNLEVDGGRCV